MKFQISSKKFKIVINKGIEIKQMSKMNKIIFKDLLNFSITTGFLRIAVWDMRMVFVICINSERLQFGKMVNVKTLQGLSRSF